jgi:NAD(P)-dependent dehydrogenase (short-subunit alcohol dehydrogenase family)
MPITLDYAEKLVVVTGGGRGIGLAITTALAKAGAEVAITYTSTDSSGVADKLSTEHGVKVRAFKCNVAHSAEVDAMLAAVESEYGRKVDIGVANAGACELA